MAVQPCMEGISNLKKKKSLKANPGKFQSMVFRTGKINSYNLFIDAVKVSSFSEVKLLEVTTDNQGKFKKYIKYTVRRPRVNFMLLEG